MSLGSTARHSRQLERMNPLYKVGDIVIYFPISGKRCGGVIESIIYPGTEDDMPLYTFEDELLPIEECWIIKTLV